MHFVGKNISNEHPDSNWGIVGNYIDIFGLITAGAGLWIAGSNLRAWKQFQEKGWLGDTLFGQAAKGWEKALYNIRYAGVGAGSAIIYGLHTDKIKKFEDVLVYGGLGAVLGMGVRSTPKLLPHCDRNNRPGGNYLWSKERVL